MFKTTLSASLMLTAALSLGACDVRKTQEGDVTLPKYEKTQDGSMTVPKYEITAPDVKLGTTEKTVSVPTVTTEEKKIEVPTVTVTPAKDK